MSHKTIEARPQIKHDYPLNLSISVSGGKEINKDWISSGERTSISPIMNPSLFVIGNVGYGIILTASRNRFKFT